MDNENKIKYLQDILIKLSYNEKEYEMKILKLESMLNEKNSRIDELEDIMIEKNTTNKIEIKYRQKIEELNNKIVEITNKYCVDYDNKTIGIN